MSSLKPLKLYNHATGPNPWKVATILEELSLPYNNEFVEFADIKKDAFLAVNPNGRVPALEDPNTGVTVWESGAIIIYLVDTYDKDHKISYASAPEKYEAIQWAMFQMSGQGPYFGQAVWFSRYHPEKIQSAVDRYVKEIERVLSVLDLQLARQAEKGNKEPWLVGNKCTYADLMFINWFGVLSFLSIDVENGKLPHFNDWLKRLEERPAVKKMKADRANAPADKSLG